MQISTDGAGIPQKAIDGSTSSFFSADTCSLTKSERVPWWYVNLLEPYMVQLVRLDFGKSCCGKWNRMWFFCVYMLSHQETCKFWAIKECCGRETAHFIVTFSGIRRWWSAAEGKKVRKLSPFWEFFVLAFKGSHANQVGVNNASLTANKLWILLRFSKKEIANRINFPMRSSKSFVYFLLRKIEWLINPRRMNFVYDTRWLSLIHFNTFTPYVY